MEDGGGARREWRMERDRIFAKRTHFGQTQSNLVKARQGETPTQRAVHLMLFYLRAETDQTQAQSNRVKAGQLSRNSRNSGIQRQSWSNPVKPSQTWSRLVKSGQIKVEYCRKGTQGTQRQALMKFFLCDLCDLLWLNRLRVAAGRALPSWFPKFAQIPAIRGYNHPFSGFG